MLKFTYVHMIQVQEGAYKTGIQYIISASTTSKGKINFHCFY